METRETQNAAAGRLKSLEPPGKSLVAANAPPNTKPGVISNNMMLSMSQNPAITLPTSSLRDTQITAPSNLLSGNGDGSPGERDEYLMRLLAKGALPKPQSLSLPTSSSGQFRVPEPVPPRGPTAPPATSLHPQLRQSTGTGTNQQQTGHTDAAAPRNTAAAAAALLPGAEAGPATANQSVQPLPRPAAGQTEAAPAWSYAQTKRRMGPEAAASLRSAAVAHQVAFLEQVYDMHRAIAVQKLLVRTCPEMGHVMAEATRLLQSSSSHQDAAAAAAGLAPPAKRHKAEAKRALHPDSQFAAVPLRGETATATGDGSGDDGDGSGGNGSGGHGSGGGSTSPQPQVHHHPIIPPTLVALQPAPSGASQTPLAFPRQQLPWGGGALPAGLGMGGMGMSGMPPQMPGGYLAAMQMQQMQYPGAAAAGGGGALNGIAMMSAADPMAWWYQNYYGRAAAANGAAGGAAAASMPAGRAAQQQVQQQHHQQQQLQQQQQQQHQQQMAAAAVAAAGGVVGAIGPTVGPSIKWWQDAQQTFGPPADPEAVAAAAAAGRNGGPAAVEVESARRGNGRNPAVSVPAAGGAPSLRYSGSQGAAAGAGIAGAGNGKRDLSLVAAPPPRRRRQKRKPADPVAEASSGTTGQDHHHHGSLAIADDAAHCGIGTCLGGSGAGRTTLSPRAGHVPDDSAAKLLLSIREDSQR